MKKESAVIGEATEKTRWHKYGDPLVSWKKEHVGTFEVSEIWNYVGAWTLNVM